MRHVTVATFGSSLGVSGARLVVSEPTKAQWETALSRLRSIRIEKKGVSISSNLLLECAARGIRVYVVDWRGIGVVAISGQHQHAVVAIRHAQFGMIDSDRARDFAAEVIRTKIRNQRAVLLYFGKYLKKSDPAAAEKLKTAVDELDAAAKAVEQAALVKREWRNALMGVEGAAAQTYWTALRTAGLLSPTFAEREGRGSCEITNAALNYGYTILQSYIWSALENAGFELYAGFLHAPRPGKPSLVLDYMEEYRAWVVDRNVIKLRSRLEAQGGKGLDADLKKAIVEAIDETMASAIVWKGKALRLENILQRQAYRLAGAVIDPKKKYKGIRFRW